jgi:signal transduction histidine kinase
MAERFLERGPRSLRFYVLLSVAYAALGYLAVQSVYNWELMRVGMLPPTFQPSDIFVDVLRVHAVSFAAWLALSVVAGVAVHRSQSVLATTLNAEERRARELAQAQASLASALKAEKRRSADLMLVSEVGESLTGPHGPSDIAAEFLRRIRRAIGERATAGVAVYDQDTQVLRGIGAAGPRASALESLTMPLDALSTGGRVQLLERQEPLLVADTAASAEEWTPLVLAVPALACAGSFCLVPLVSRGRLVGALVLQDDAPGMLDPECVNVVTILARYLAGALRNALSVAEAASRAERANLVNHVAQRARASGDPDEVLEATVNELGAALAASRALVRLDSTDADLRAAYQWTAAGVMPLSMAALANFPVGALVMREGRTVAIADVRAAPRPSDFLGGDEELVRSGLLSVLATPIILAGRLVGVLAVSQADAPRVWSSDDVRLVEALARELRVAIASARLFQARKRESERLLALHSASRALAAQTDPKVVLEEILRSAVSLLGGGSGSFYRWDPQAALLRCAHNYQVPASDPTPDVRLGEGIAGRTFAQMKPLLINDYPGWDNATFGGISAGLQALLCVPLICSGSPLGVLLVRSYDTATRFTDDDLRLLSLFGDQAAAAFLTAEAFERQRRAMEELERLSKAKSDFVSVVSHEFRTPLTGIRGFSEMMMDEDFTIEEMKEFASDINNEAQRLNRLINEMLDLDRMESGRMTLNIEPVDLNAIISEIADRTRPATSDHRIRLDLDSQLPPLAGDRDKLVQVVTNLVSNAVKYSPQGGEILITSRVDGDMAHVCVRDHGMGIPADALDKVFERYTRIESGAGRLIQGTGLGLPIVRQIVELHGGKTWVESTLGEGSAFQFSLPLGVAPGGD